MQNTKNDLSNPRAPNVTFLFRKVSNSKAARVENKNLTGVYAKTCRSSMLLISAWYRNTPRKELYDSLAQAGIMLDSARSATETPNPVPKCATKSLEIAIATHVQNLHLDLLRAENRQPCFRATNIAELAGAKNEATMRNNPQAKRGHTYSRMGAARHDSSDPTTDKCRNLHLRCEMPLKGAERPPRGQNLKM